MTRTEARILAKSPSGARVIDLTQHSRDVVTAASLLFGPLDGSMTRLGEAWCHFFDLRGEARAKFRRSLAVAAWLHDLGKANNGFQDAVRNRGEQTIRHEHISALLLRLEPWKTWLGEIQDIDVEAVIAAILCHHVKSSPENLAQPFHPMSFTVRLALSAPEVGQIWEGLGTELEVPAPPTRADLTWRKETLDGDTRREEFARAAYSYRRRMMVTPHLWRVAVATKAALIVADAVGSAIVRMDVPVEDWIRKCFGPPPLTAGWLQSHIIGPRQRQIEERTGRTFAWLDFQEAAGTLGPRALLLSACGSGKTLAAWNWVRAQLERRSAARVIFLYPTRATATEGFRDYVSWAGGGNASLVHGTAEYDLEGLFENPDDPRHEERYTSEQRLFGLTQWDRRAFSATVDQFLSFLACRYASLCLLPLLADSVVVVDEVHSFDARMFRHLEMFLTSFPNLPVLCMTATLTQDRLRLLQNIPGMQTFPSKSESAFEGLKASSEAPRYRFLMGDYAEAKRLCLSALDEGKRVLWVVNTVDRCQQATKNLRGGTSAEVLCYHSRFRLCERRERHEEAVTAFRRAGARVLVATQVCEMSLDLDADVLITELAPASSLIQRAGRCWRREPGTGLGTVFVYDAATPAPYGSEDLEAAREFLRAFLLKDSVSQEALAVRLAEVRPKDLQARAGPEDAPFLFGGMYANAADESFREEDGFTVDVVLDGDIAEYVRLRKANDASAAGLICPVPRAEAFADPMARLERHRRTARSSQYDLMTGYHRAAAKHKETNA